jgi:hypothetical protein
MPEATVKVIEDFQRGELVVKKFGEPTAYKQYLADLHSEDRLVHCDMYAGGVRAEVCTGTSLVDGVRAMYALVNLERCGTRIYLLALIRDIAEGRPKTVIRRFLRGLRVAAKSLQQSN